MAKLADLFILLGLKKEGFDKGLDDAKQKTTAFGGSMKKLGGMIAGAFAVSSVISFGKELFSIAQKADGIQSAFAKIASRSDLDNLKQSVKGTVSELELMQRAVQANNFGIPVQNLGKLFEFATKRAQDTGQSVDYLVDSIVLGIGRKSPLILDNLGISAVQLKSKLGGVGTEMASVGDIAKAVGEIAEDAMRKTGDITDNLGVKVQRLGATWDNLKTQISSLFNNAEWLANDLDDWSQVMEIWQAKEISKWDKFWASISGESQKGVYAKLMQKREENDYLAKLNGNSGESSGGPITPVKQVENIKAMKDRLETYKEELELINIEDTKAIDKQREKIRLLDEQIKKITDIGAAEKKTAKQRLADIEAENQEREAERILRMEFYGEKMTPMSSKYQTAGDFQLQGSALGEASNFVFQNLDSSYKLVSEKRKKFTKEQLQDWTDFTEELNATIESGMEGAVGSFASGIGELMATGDWSNFGSGLLKSIGGFMQQMGMLFIAYAIASKGFAAALGLGPANPMAWGLAMAAGVGLVAAGSAISSLASSGMKGGGGGASMAGGYSSSMASSNGIKIEVGGSFELEGTKLRAAIHNTERKNNLIR